MNKMSLLGVATILSVFSAVFTLPSGAVAASAPLASSRGAEFITEQSAQFIGWVNPNETVDTYRWFEWSFAGRADGYTTRKVKMGATPATVKETINGLAPNTTYCYRIIAENSRGRDAGQLACFTTKKLEDSVTPESRALTIGTKSILATSATLRGYVAPHTVTATYWFEYGTTNALGLRSRSGSRSNSSGYVEIPITGLTPETTYFYRIVSESAEKRWFGEAKSFQTDKAISVAQGSTAQAPSQSRAGGMVTENDTAILTGDETLYWMKADEINRMNGISRVRISWDLTGGNTLLATFGSFSLAYGPTKSLGGGVIQYPSRRDLRSWASFDVPSGDEGVYVQGTYRAANKTYTGPIEYLGPSTKDPARSSATTGATKQPTQGGVSTAATPSPSGVAGIPKVSIPSIQVPKIGALSQTSSVGSSKGFFGFGGKSAQEPKETLTLLQSTTGSRKPHEPIEYTIRYANETGKTITDAVLRVAFPKNVIYIGDNTNNEFLVEENPESKERTYVLPLGTLVPGAARTITMIGMMTSDTTTSPVARSWVTYKDASGDEKVRLNESVDREEIEQHEQGITPAKESGSTSSTEGGFFSKLFGGGDEPKIKDEPTLLHTTDGNGEEGKPITYTIRYANETDKTMENAKLRFTLPRGVEYAGNDTGTDVTVEEDPLTGAKTYTLLVGTLKPGEGRTIAVTGKSSGEGPIEGEIVTEMEYTDENGTTQIMRGTKADEDMIAQSEENTDRVATAMAEAVREKGPSEGWRVFPTTLLGWLVLIMLLIALIVGWEKGRAWYLAKKKEIEAEEKLWKEQRA